MNNKKYQVDISLEIEAADITVTGKPNLLITKEINGQKIVLDLPVVEEGTAEGFILDEIYDHYWNAVDGKQGFWIREKTERTKTGLELQIEQ